ncbi:hypothetical protein ACJIZ3_000187 [Penstemon smallii]|uniref:Uncharacterized protein n=1 Tax=Penstemon smallii TaxID=265156 RepID=A0ABD3R7V5_9LAMI
MESNALEGNILMTMPKFREVLEDHINKCQLLFLESQSLDEDLEKVRKEMISFVETMKKILKEYSNANETSNVTPLVDSVTQIDMVGVYDEDLQELIYKLLPGETRWRMTLKVISVEGMAGIE